MLKRNVTQRKFEVTQLIEYFHSRNSPLLGRKTNCQPQQDKENTKVLSNSYILTIFKARWTHHTLVDITWRMRITIWPGSLAAMDSCLLGLISMTWPTFQEGDFRQLHILTAHPNGFLPLQLPPRDSPSPPPPPHPNPLAHKSYMRWLMDVVAYLKFCIWLWVS